MSSEITIFEHEMFGEIRIVDQHGDPWFVAKDVAKALGYANTRQAIRTHCEGARPLEGAAQQPPPVIIPEFDLYALVLGSQKPGAKGFRRWVCGEVLPAIRKTGTYSVPDAKEQKECLVIGYKAWAEVLAMAQDTGLACPEYCARELEGVKAALTQTALPIDGGQLDVSTYLEGRGLSPRIIRTIRSSFGRHLKALYIETNGGPPGTVPRRIDGAERQVCYYLTSDRDLFDQVYDEYYEGVK